MTLKFTETEWIPEGKPLLMKSVSASRNLEDISDFVVEWK